MTALKMRRLQSDPEMCLGTLTRAESIEFAPDAITSTQAGCGAAGALTLTRAKLVYGGGVRLTCPALAALAMWERHSVIPAAKEVLGTEVARVLHYGTYSCRNVNSAATGRRSKHASARAIDIAGFELKDGRRITVLQDWDAETPEGRFLARVHEGACGYFGGVLGPDYNAAHKDHFHFEMSGWGFCR
ncbi:extensin-like domain-containing protein [Tepidicaulis sp. LMO-SS28]|uniref:extensin-like domain-containing protein n=1 Tax=Tepidicaulis sp. LMO-SS28 TaxID=3447455 RepID=UPI003EE24096